MIDKGIIMAGAAFIICIAIFVLASIQVKAYAKRPLDYYGNEAMQKVLYATAYRLVTSQMSHIQIYKQNGGIRAPVERKIYEKMQMLTLPMPEGRGFLAQPPQPAPARSYAMSPSV